MRVDVVDYQNIWMIESAGSTGLLFKAMQSIWIRRKIRCQDFDGDISPQTGVARAVDFTHSARAQGRDNLIWPKSCSSGDRHIRTQAEGLLSYGAVFYLRWPEDAS